MASRDAVRRASSSLGTDGRLEVFALGTLHAALLVLLVVTLAYRGGGLGEGLAALHTSLGMALFGLLWLLAWWSTARALRGVAVTGSLRAGLVLERGLIWGGVAGLLVLLALAALAAVVGAAELVREGGVGLDPRALLEAAALLAIVSPLLAAFAFVAGAAVGCSLGLLDWLALRSADGALRMARRAGR